MARHVVLAVAALLLVAAGPLPAPPSAGSPSAVAGPVGGDDACDDLDEAKCLLPFPNDLFTAPADTPTGKRVDLALAAMPRNVAGKPIDPTEWNRNDGFSPGSMMLTFVPELDLEQTFGIGDAAPAGSDAATVADVIERPALTLADTSPMVLVDADTGERHPFWAELDTHPDTADDERLLILRPTVNLAEGHRYVVALRDLRDHDGERIDAGGAFRRLRDGRPGREQGPDEPRGRAAHYEQEIFPVLADAGVARDASLYLAWDFTVASQGNLAGRALAIRDDAFAQLGDRDLADGQVAGDAPAFAVTEVVEHDAGDTQRTVRGTVTVPNYLTLPQDETRLSSPVEVPEDQLPAPVDDVAGLLDEELPVQPPGSRFVYDSTTPGPMATPVQNPVAATTDAEFECHVPATASAASPARPALYGHGLLGGARESGGSSTERMRERNFAMCAVDWIGMATEDLPNVATILADVSHFPTLADRTQQGFVNFMYLGRALVHEDGLGAHPAFEDDAGRALLDTGELVYDGNSQGGIMGGALTALSPDLTRAVLGVPATNYSTLLNRSVDWEGAYGDVLYATYPDKQDQQLIFALIQMLWDRGEGNGYAQHMTDDPLPNTPPHQVLLHVAFGDYQVANVAAEVEARTIGAALLVDSVPARHWAGGHAGFGFDTFTDAHTGSALVYWDSGNDVPPNGNVPPPGGDGGDPHGDPRKDELAMDQKAHFYATGEVVGVDDYRTRCYSEAGRAC